MSDQIEHTKLPNLKTTHTHLRTLARRQAGNIAPTGTPAVRQRRNIVQCPPGIVDAGVDSLYEIAGSMIRSGVDYWTGLLDRGATPWDAARDVLDWTKEINRREKPEWASPPVYLVAALVIVLSGWQIAPGLLTR